MDNLGRILIVVGIGILLTGGILLLLSRLPFLNTQNGLPGDIRIEGQNFTCIIPLASMLLVSVVLTIVLNIIIRLINR